MTTYFHKGVPLKNNKVQKTEFLGFEKVREWVEQHSAQLAQTQMDIIALKKLSNSLGMSMVNTTLFNDWKWSEPQWVDVGTLKRIKFGDSSRNVIVDRYKITGVRVDSQGLHLISEPEIPISITLSPEAYEGTHTQGIKFNTALANSNLDKGAVVMDPVQLVVDTRSINSVLNVSVLNKFNQVVGAVQIENFDGQVEVQVWDTESSINGSSPSQISNPSIRFDEIPNEPQISISSNPDF